ncbi:MAG: DUF4135 domain-containing protein [Candidatus Nanopelagicales bacterium]
MPTAEASLPELLARAADPWERAAGGWLRLRAEPEGVAEANWARWLTLVGDGTAAGASAVLDARGLTREDVLRAFGPAAPAEYPDRWEQRPEWARDAEELVSLLEAGAEPAGRPASDRVPTLSEVVGTDLPPWAPGDLPWRFDPGFRAWLDEASSAVAEWTSRFGAPLDQQAQSDLTLGLARQLLGIVGPRLQELAEVRPELFPTAAQAPASWWRIWREYPVMLRVTAVAWRQWRITTAELIERMAADLPGIAPGRRVAGLASDAGDRHSGGRGVTIVTLDDASRLFYKPRPGGVERPLAQLLGELDAVGPRPLGVRLPEVEDMGEYLWVREVAAAECSDPRDYFFHAGALLRVMQGLGATDLHHENFVPTADQPVLVDLETVIGPGRGWVGGDATKTAQTQPRAGGATSAHEPRPDLPGPTSMVSSWADGPPGRRSLNLGAMAGPEVALTPYPVPALVQTDEGPALRHSRMPSGNGAALPRVAGEPTGVSEYRDDVVAGFAAAHSRLTALARESPGTTGRSALLGGQAEVSGRIRFVPRATRVYSRLLQESLSAESLRDGVARELVLERLWRAVGTCPPGVIEAEQHALRELDVPLFTIPLSGTSLISDRGVEIPAAFAESPLSGAAALMSEVALSSPEGALDDLHAELFCASPVSSAEANPAGAELILGCDPVAELLAARLERPDGSPAWIGLDYDPSRYTWRNRRLGPGLLGEAGIGLALVAAGTPGSEAARVGRAALLTSGRRVTALRPGWDDADAFVGPAGVVYALAWAARAHDDHQLLSAAEALIGNVLASARSARPTWGVDAVAGAVLALGMLAEDSTTARAAFGEAADLLVGAPPVSPDLADQPVGSWHEAMPSAAWGRALARKAAGLPPGEPITAASVGDQLAAAALGDASVPAEYLESSLLLEPGVPISRNLSAVHGVAAVALLGLGDAPSAPKVRILQ